VTTNLSHLVKSVKNENVINRLT